MSDAKQSFLSRISFWKDKDEPEEPAQEDSEDLTEALAELEASRVDRAKELKKVRTKTQTLRACSPSDSSPGIPVQKLGATA